MTGIAPLVGVSVNCQWPGFGSTQRTARPWSQRGDEIGAKIARQRPAFFMLQEAGQQSVGGQALDVVENAGSQYQMQAFVLNAAVWDESIFDYVSTLEIPVPDGGQHVPGYAGSGRGCIAVKLRHRKTKARFRIGSFHLAVAGSTLTATVAAQLRLAQMKKIVSTLNDDEDDWPLILAGDTNTKWPALGRSALSVAKDYGWRWPVQPSIDRVFGNYGGVVDSVASIDLGTSTDHHMRRFTSHTIRA